MIRRGEIEPTPVDDIVVRGRWRSPTAEQVEVMRKSLRENGLLTAVAVRIVDELEIEGETRRGVPVLVFGATRLAAATAEGWKDIDTQVLEGSDLDFEKAELAENLHRGELTKLQRDQQLARYIRLCEQEQEVLRPEDAKPQGGRPKGGVRAAARELNLPEATARKAIATETITAPAAAAVTELGLANSPGAYREVAKESTPEAQVAKAHEIGQRRAVRANKPAKARKRPGKASETATAATAHPENNDVTVALPLGIRDLVNRLVEGSPASGGHEQSTQYYLMDLLDEMTSLAADMCDVLLDAGDRAGAVAIAQAFGLPISLIPMTYAKVCEAIDAAALPEEELQALGGLEITACREHPSYQLSVQDLHDFRHLLKRVGITSTPAHAESVGPADPALAAGEDSAGDDEELTAGVGQIVCEHERAATLLRPAAIARAIGNSFAVASVLMSVDEGDGT